MSDATAGRFAVGAIGRPGERVFLLEVQVEGDTHWFQIEKTQVAALAAQSSELLRDAGYAGVGAGIDATLGEPEEIVFRVREVRLVYREERGMITVTLSAGDDEPESTIEFDVTAAQLDAFARAGEESVGAGRPRCPKCGLAMDPDGHPCPTGNGDLRSHRP